MDTALIEADPPARTGGSGLAHAAGAVTNDPRTGQFRTGGELTDQQRAFVAAYVRNGCNAAAAAQEAGYAAARQEGYRLTRHPAVMLAVREELTRKIYVEGASIAVGVVLNVMQDVASRPSDKVAAARLMFEAAKLIKSDKAKNPENPLGAKALADMNMDELETFIAAGNRALANKRQPVIVDGSAQDSAQSAEPSAASD